MKSIKPALNTPVVFFIFNRPKTTQMVFESIRGAKPSKLLVVADGPRENLQNEYIKCSEARSIIDRVDWECEIFKNYSDYNLGCKRRISSGIDWVFSMVDEAILLEDDCLPSADFFSFCSELLSYYRNDTRIMHIGGSNLARYTSPDEAESYYFSKLVNIWGWATWKRAWQYYDVDIMDFPSLQSKQGFREQIFSGKIAENRIKQYEKTYDGQIDTWDYQWQVTCMAQNGLAIVPYSNLVSNLGFGKDSSHTSNENSKLSKISLRKLNFPLNHPKYILRNVSADIKYLKDTSPQPLASRIVQKIIKYMPFSH
jgi:hypothetical protein